MVIKSRKCNNEQDKPSYGAHEPGNFQNGKKDVYSLFAPTNSRIYTCFITQRQLIYLRDFCYDLQHCRRSVPDTRHSIGTLVVLNIPKPPLLRRVHRGPRRECQRENRSHRSR